MRNSGLPPTHLPSPPHFKDVANIVADLKAFVSEYPARARQEDARCQQLLAKQANIVDILKAIRQEVAAARARLEAACVSDAIACARQDDKYDNNDEYNDDDEYDNNDEYDDDDEYNDNNEYDDDNKYNDDDDYNGNDNEYNDDDYYNDDNDAKDTYDDVAGRLKAYAATLFARVDATMTKIQAMDDGFENRAATQEKVLVCT